MKKMLVFLMLGVLVFTGCGKEEEKKVEKKTDYSEYAFTDVNWVRDSGHDIETISFKADGSFSYTCACGNPVNDADLCETYTYNDETKEIKLDCFETTEETVLNIKVVEMSDNALELDFDGEIRKFEKEK